MKEFLSRWGSVICVLGIISAEIISATFGGWRGCLGITLGLGATWFNCWALWMLIGFMGRAVEGSGSSKGLTALVILAFLFKLPLLIGLGLLTRFLGGVAFPCFVSGLGMVYFGLVGWAVARA